METKVIHPIKVAKEKADTILHLQPLQRNRRSILPGSRFLNIQSLPMPVGDWSESSTEHATMMHFSSMRTNEKVIQSDTVSAQNLSVTTNHSSMENSDNGNESIASNRDKSVKTKIRWTSMMSVTSKTSSPNSKESLSTER